MTKISIWNCNGVILWEVQSCQMFFIRTFFKMKMKLFIMNLLLLLFSFFILHSFQRKRTIGKTMVKLSVHLSLRPPCTLPPFESFDEEAEVSETTAPESQRNSRQEGGTGPQTTAFSKGTQGSLVPQGSCLAVG